MPHTTKQAQLPLTSSQAHNEYESHDEVHFFSNLIRRDTKVRVLLTRSILLSYSIVQKSSLKSCVFVQPLRRGLLSFYQQKLAALSAHILTSLHQTEKHLSSGAIFNSLCDQILLRHIKPFPENIPCWPRQKPAIVSLHLRGDMEQQRRGQGCILLRLQKSSNYSNIHERTRKNEGSQSRSRILRMKKSR